MENEQKRLDAETTAIIDRCGVLTLMQHDSLYSQQRAEKVVLSAQAAYDLLVWMHDNHLELLHQQQSGA